MRFSTAIFFFFAACTPKADGPKADAAPASDSAISSDVRKKVCETSPCGGDRSMITVYRDGAGKVARLQRLYGACSHNPAIYFDPSGAQTEMIPEKPVTPGSAEANEFQAKADKQIGGLTKSESVFCGAPGGGH